MRPLRRTLDAMATATVATAMMLTAVLVRQLRRRWDPL